MRVFLASARCVYVCVCFVDAVVVGPLVAWVVVRVCGLGIGSLGGGGTNGVLMML